MKLRIRFGLLLAGIVLFLGAGNLPRFLTVQQIVQLVNQDRIEHGLSTLTVNPTLNQAAYAKAEDMLSKNYFGHVSPTGTSPWYWFKTLGYNYTYAGENLAAGYTNATDLENSWMNSPKHRANILSPFYSDMGLAVVNDNNTTLIVQLFGSKSSQVTLRQ